MNYVFEYPTETQWEDVIGRLPKEDVISRLARSSARRFEYDEYRPWAIDYLNLSILIAAPSLPSDDGERQYFFHFFGNTQRVGIIPTNGNLIRLISPPLEGIVDLLQFKSAIEAAFGVLGAYAQGPSTSSFNFVY